MSYYVINILMHFSLYFSQLGQMLRSVTAALHKDSNANSTVKSVTS